MAALPDLPTQGPADAPVTIVEFSDFQCPYCARGTQTLDQLLALHPEDVRVVFAHYPLPNHDWARPAAIASQCAYDQSQEAFWTLHDAYFQNQRRFSKDEIVSQSREVLADTGIDLEAWSTCAGDPSSESYQAAAETVDETLEIGSEFGVSGTPGFFINGFFLNGAQPLEAFERTIEQAQNTSP
jgi:protein-disulfide isomerase